MKKLTSLILTCVMTSPLRLAAAVVRAHLLPMCRESFLGLEAAMIRRPLL